MAAKFSIRSVWRTLLNSKLWLTERTKNTNLAKSMSNQAEAPRQDGGAMDKLRAFGYDFNEAGKLKQLDAQGAITEERFEFEKTSDQALNQQHYESLGEIINEVIYELLEKEGLTRTYFPSDVPQEEATFIFTKPSKLENSKKLLVLIHGSGAVRAGQWARSLIINFSINNGSMIPYIKRATELGYDILITNTNDNTRLVGGEKKKIKGSESPSQHAINVWEKYVIASDPQSVAIVAHSMGGYITMELVNKFPDFFKDRVFGVALTDSVDAAGHLQGRMREYISKIGCNWITSTKILDDAIDDTRNSIMSISAGTNIHEWTSYTAMDSVFKFLTDRYEVFLEEKSQELESKRPKLG